MQLSENTRNASKTTCFHPLETKTLQTSIPSLPSGERRIKYVVGDVTVYVVAERVQYYGNDGKLITESLKDYTRKAVRNEYTSLDQFLRRWTNAEKKQVIIDELR